MIGVWLLISSIPYYTLSTYTWAASLGLIDDRSRFHMSMQAVSSAFFNSNHCINIIIYVIFYRDFRSCFTNILARLNPYRCFCKKKQMPRTPSLMVPGSGHSAMRSRRNSPRQLNNNFDYRAYMNHQDVIAMNSRRPSNRRGEEQEGALRSRKNSNHNLLVKKNDHLDVNL
jgi:hypothetical protein